MKEKEEKNTNVVTIPTDSIAVGTYSGSARGYGFVTIEGREDDLFIPPDKTGGALHGDTVKVEIQERESRARGKRTEGRVVEVLERVNDVIVGTFQRIRTYGFVIADNQKLGRDVFVSEGKEMGAVDGSKVVVKILNPGNEVTNPEGEVVEILGHLDDPGSDLMTVIRGFHLPEEFPPEVLEEVKRISQNVLPQEREGRMDLRDIPMVTIDGEESKDLDDAVSVEKTETGYRLGVHIADVSHYVKEGSPLDQEALARATSIYLVNKVIPMLPHALSNGICSLNAGEERLALSCLMDFDSQGNILAHEIGTSVILVNRRMTYHGVSEILAGDSSVLEEQQDLLPMFQVMEELSSLIRKKREERGSIDFDLPESKITVDETGKPIKIEAYDRNPATLIIEDFMLSANEVVAEDFCRRKIPFVYRVHENPDEEKIRAFGILINNFGFSIPPMKEGKMNPQVLQRLLGQIEGNKAEAMISRLMLRSMKQARYDTECLGHFGLSAEYYCHFTSPIRRYPDLQIHRIMKEVWKGAFTPKRKEHYESILPGVAQQSSARERLSNDSERAVEKLKKVEYMGAHIGEAFQGIVSGVTNWGIYVELPNTVEGIIRLENIRGDYYTCDAENYCLVGEKTGKTIRLGDAIAIRVKQVDKLARSVEFLPDPGRELSKEELQGGSNKAGYKGNPKQGAGRNASAKGNSNRDKSHGGGRKFQHKKGRNHGSGTKKAHR